MFYECVYFYLASIEFSHGWNEAQVNIFRAVVEARSHNAMWSAGKRERKQPLLSIHVEKPTSLCLQELLKTAIMPGYLPLYVKGIYWRSLSSVLLLPALAEAACRFIQLIFPLLFYTDSFCQYKHRSKLKCFKNEARDKRQQLVPRGRAPGRRDWGISSLSFKGCC